MRPLLVYLPPVGGNRHLCPHIPATSSCLTPATCALRDGCCSPTEGRCRGRVRPSVGVAMLVDGFACVKLALRVAYIALFWLYHLFLFYHSKVFQNKSISPVKIAINLGGKGSSGIGQAGPSPVQNDKSGKSERERSRAPTRRAKQRSCRRRWD